MISGDRFDEFARWITLRTESLATFPSSLSVPLALRSSPFNYVTRNPRNSTYRSIVTGTYLIFHPFSSLQIRISIRFVERSGYRILVSISVTSTWIEIFLLLDDPLSFSSPRFSPFSYSSIFFHSTRLVFQNERSSACKVSQLAN